MGEILILVEMVLADFEENAQRKAAGKKEIPLSLIAIEVVRRINALFEIERSINGKNAAERLAIRRMLSAPLVDNLKPNLLSRKTMLFHCKPPLSSEENPPKS